jgi:Beta-lactamase
MKPTDRMLAGSVGKTFAAATALQLIKEGKIGLDDKIEKYLGREQWFARLPNAKDITIRQLMNHTSGLVRYEFKEQFTKDLTANPEKVWRPDEEKLTLNLSLWCLTTKILRGGYSFDRGELPNESQTKNSKSVSYILSLFTRDGANTAGGEKRR